MTVQKAIIKQYFEHGKLAIPSSSIHAFLNKTMDGYDVEALLYAFYNEKLISGFEVLIFDERKASRAKNVYDKYKNENNKEIFQLLLNNDITILLFSAREYSQELKDMKMILKFLNIKYDAEAEDLLRR